MEVGERWREEGRCDVLLGAVMELWNSPNTSESAVDDNSQC